MMETKKVTPWVDWNEWKTVVDDAYNEKEDPVLFRRALSAIIAWEARDSYLPSGLLGLKELLVAKLAKINCIYDTIDGNLSYQSTIAINIVRFVNFITEPYQTTTHAKTVKSITNQLGIPDWIVNIRHTATHFTLPSIEVLENAVTYLFEYIKKRYVNTYKETTLEQSILESVKNYIKNEFTNYMNARYKLTLIRVKKNDKTILENASVELDEKINSAASNFKNETFEILLEDGFMIPLNEQLIALGIMSEEFLEQDNLVIPKSFLNIWNKFLAFCDDNNLIGFLFSNLVNTYKAESSIFENQENLRNKFLLSWIIYLLKFNSYRNEKTKSTKFQFHFTYKQVLLDILSNRPNRFTVLFLKEIKKIASFSSDIGEQIFEKIRTLTTLVNMSNGIAFIEDQTLNEQICEMDLNEEFSFYDLAPFEKSGSANNKQDLFSKTKENQWNTKNANGWQLIDDINWNYENLKLGFIENQSQLNFNLDIDQLNEEESNLSLNSSLNQSLQENQDSGSINQKNLRELKNKLMHNYWEFAS